jgi:hypothetical protein
MIARKKPIIKNDKIMFESAVTWHDAFMVDIVVL